MNVPIVIFALLSMVLWGLEELLLKEAIGRLKSVTTFFINTVAGGVLSFLVIFIAFPHEVTLLSLHDWLILLIATLTAFGGYIFFYMALEEQEVSLVAAMDESWIVISVLIGVAFLGENLTAFHILLIASILAGAFLVSVDFSHLKKRIFIKGSGYTAIAIFCTGLAIPFEKIFITNVGQINAIVYMYALYFPLILISKYFVKGKWVRPTKKLFVLASLSGFADGAAFAFYVFAIRMGNISVVAPIVASSVIVTLLLAKIYLKEKMTTQELVGALFVILGVVALSTIYG